jgi:hypothetical protein
MTTRHGRPSAEARTAVWIDNDRAIVVHGGPDDLQIVEVLTRRSSEEESRFETRTGRIRANYMRTLRSWAGPNEPRGGRVDATR